MRKNPMLFMAMITLLVLGTLQACNKKDNPLAPTGGTPAPAATPTSGLCFVNTSTPCSPTPTFTSTSTPTVTSTSTITDTPTITHTNAGGNTSTFTHTRTWTSTSTITNTPTITLSPTPSWTRTNTFTITNTYSPTRTFTRTNTFSPTPTTSATNTPTVTSTPVTGNGLTGAVTLAISGPTVDASHPLYVHIDNSPTFNGGVNANTLVTTNGGTYLFSPLPADTYYIVTWYDTVGGGDDHPHVGDWYKLYDNTCNMGSGTGTSVSSSVVTRDLTVDTACSFTGLYGNVTYDGSGTVDPSHRLIVEFYSDPLYRTLLMRSDVDSNGGRYDLIDNIATGTVYQAAFYDSNNNGTRDPNEAFAAFGPHTVGTTQNKNIWFDNSNHLGNTGYRIAGRFQYTGIESVSRTHPMVIYVFASPDFSGGPVAGYLFYSSTDGGYAFDAPSPGPWYLILEQAKGGLGCDGPCVGDPMMVWNQPACGLTPTAINIGSGLEQNLAFGDSCLLGGVTGDANLVDRDYNPSSLTVDSSHPIRIWSYSDPLYVTRFSIGNSEGRVNSNGDSYQLVSPASSGTTLYQLAFYDQNDNGTFDLTEPYQALGPYDPNAFPTRTVTIVDQNRWTGYFVQGNVTYTGSNTVDDSHYLMVHLGDDPNFTSPVYETNGVIAVNGGYYNLPVPGPGDYYLAAIMNRAGVPMENGPHVGDPYELYNDRGTFPGTAFTVSGRNTLNFSFGDTYRFVGFTGNVEYTNGGVGSSHPIRFLAYSDANYTMPVPGAQSEVRLNDTRYDMVLMSGSTTAVYLRVWFDDNNNGTIDGEPFLDLGLQTPNTGSPVLDVVFNEKDNGGRLTGTITTTASGVVVDSSHPLWVYASGDPYMNSEGAGDAVTVNGGTYLIPSVPSNVTGYLAAWVDIWGRGTGLDIEGPAPGDYYIVSDNQCGLPADPHVVNGILTYNIAFDSFCRFSGYRGAISYSGSYGPVDFSHRLIVAAWDNASYSGNPVQRVRISSSGATYYLGMPWASLGTTYWLRAYLDQDNNGSLSTGDPYETLGPQTTNYGTPVLDIPVDDSTIY